MTQQRLVSGYFTAQGIVGIAFWIAMGSPTFRSWIELVPSHRPVTDAFVAADFLVGVLGSFATAWAVERQHRLAGPAAAFTLGGILYPTLYLVNFVAATGRGTVPLAIMIVPSVLTSWATYLTIRTPPRMHQPGGSAPQGPPSE